MKRGLSRVFAISLTLTLTLMLGCGAKSAEEPPPGVSSATARPSASYAFESLDKRPISSAAFAGKPVVLVFVTTWDIPSQAQVRFLVEMDKKDQGKVAYAAIFLQESKERELIEVYKSTLGIPFPIAIADQGTLASTGPFGDVQAVPTTVVLDRRGQVRFQKVGLAEADELRGVLRKL